LKEKEKEHFSQFINDEPFSSYILRKRRDGEHGNNLEIQALSELFNRPVEVFVPENGATPINIFHTDYKTTDVPIRLSYHDGNHYNAIVDPLCPTAGLGLGLPGLEPGLADRLQLEQAKDESDKLHVRKVAEETYLTDLNRVIEESKLSANPQCNNKMDIYTQQKLLALSDWEETDADLEQVAIQNSMESFWTMEQNRKQPWNNTHLHRRRSKNYRAGSPSSSFDHQDRTRFVSHSLGYNSTYTDSVRIASVNGSSREPVLSNAPVVSSSYASSSVDSMSGNETHAPHSEFIETPIEYPQTVQELVMNGFELSQVIRAYDLIGDHFDDILNFLLSNKQI
jgi:OTU domain-containing protein 5